MQVTRIESHCIQLLWLGCMVGSAQSGSTALVSHMLILFQEFSHHIQNIRAENESSTSAGAHRFPQSERNSRFK